MAARATVSNVESDTIANPVTLEAEKPNEYLRIIKVNAENP